MKRRSFLAQSTLFTAGAVLSLNNSSYANFISNTDIRTIEQLYESFKTPPASYHPFVRWWWNGAKIEKDEISRELRLLKEVGIMGVEINTIAFPDRTDDMDIRTVKWLGDEWIDLLKHAIDEARSLDMTCDILVGTGFPAGAEFLQDGERSQIVVIGVKKLKGPVKREFSVFDLLKEADPDIYRPYSGRQLKLLKVQLVPDPMNDLKEVIDLSDQIDSGTIRVSVPEGNYAVYALVKAEGFMRVIKGTPGGMGPVLNHFSGTAVKKYLNHISTTIQDRIGPFAPNVRSFFVDSLEVEGANWTDGMMDEFKKRRGYDIYPYLPFILFKIGRMGNTSDPNYPADYGHELNEQLQRMRYDFALTKAELFRETFIENYTDWCHKNKIKSRAQAYGRNYFLLEGSFDIDIPECETWLKYGIGEDIPEADFTRYPWQLGQGNSMINKFVSSAAHLKDKRLVSSEELTNTEMVFNESLEIFKIAGDQSTISGVTQPVFHGFNYSPKEAPFPGWITWGGYFNEKNTMWPYLKHYTDYRARLSYILQQASMYADIALLAPIPDMWSKYGAQMEPFPSIVYPDYQMLIWESIHKNGSGCDYVSEDVIVHAQIKDGQINYGSRNYHTLFLIDVEGINPSTARKLHEFIKSGGRIFCIERYPDKSIGWKNFSQKDAEVRMWVGKMKAYPDRFVFLEKPESNFELWYKEVQDKYSINPYVKIKEVKRHITQMRYQNKRMELFFFINSSNKHDYVLDASFDKKTIEGKQPWLWDAVTGERFRMSLDDNSLRIKMGPADSKLIVFSDEKTNGKEWHPVPQEGRAGATKKINSQWKVAFKYINGRTRTTEMKVLHDLKEGSDYVHFGGTVTYKTTFDIEKIDLYRFLNLGKVYGISEVSVNGKPLETKWYGHRIYPIEGLLHKGTNTLEVKVTTVMGNYMKSLLDNEIAQYWTNKGRKDQPLHSMGLAGPVQFY